MTFGYAIWLFGCILIGVLLGNPDRPLPFTLAYSFLAGAVWTFFCILTKVIVLT